MKYFAVCYGHVCRWEKAETHAKACRQAFGHADYKTMTVKVFPSNPKYMPLYKRTPFLEALYARHKEKTGSEIK